MKKLIAALILVSCLISLKYSACAAEGTTSESEAGAIAAAPTVNFDEELSGIAHANSEAAVIKNFEGAVSKCKACEDFGKFASDAKKILEENPSFKYASALDYAIAKARIDELSCLVQKNDIESGRLYMSVNDSYRNEALDYLDKSLKNSKSKDLILDAYLLKFLATKEEFQPQAAEAFLDDMAAKIATYSNDSALNERQLARMAEELAGNGLENYALKLKIAYAKKVDSKSAEAVFEDIKKDGDKNFAQGNMKEASAIYDAYIAAGKTYFKNEVMGAKLMEVAEKYFGANRYREARKYYEIFAADYQESKVIDYCNYKITLCYYYEKNDAKAVASLENFLSAYQNSIWFDKAFETLCRLYFSNFPSDKAIMGLQKLTDNYYRKNIGDFAYILIALLHYTDKEYKKALDVLKKVDINSVYAYTADTIVADIKDIKKGSKPSYSFGSKDKYRMWEPGTITVEMVPMAAGDANAWLKGSAKGEDKRLEVTYTESGVPQINVAPGAKIKFTLGTLSDEDKFAEYLQDKEDLSRLPKKTKEGKEKDLLSLQWTSGGGKFIDERQSRDKAWQAPDQPGEYKIAVSIDDLGLVRIPDKGIRKDATKDITIVVNVKA